MTFQSVVFKKKKKTVLKFLVFLERELSFSTMSSLLKLKSILIFGKTNTVM